MNTEFKTDNISLAAFLLTQNVPLVDILEVTPHRYNFVFSLFDRCIELKRNYLNNAVAPARELFNQKDALITEIKNKK